MAAYRGRSTRTLDGMSRFAALLTCLAFPLASAAADSCDALVPPNLQSILLSRFSEYRLPRESDNLNEDVRYARGRGGSGCLGVETGDFDGRGRLSYIVAMTARTGDGAVVLVAIPRGHTWAIHTLDVLKTGRSRLYVSSMPAGSYDDVGDGPEAGAEEHLACPHPLALFGTTEASGVAYCFLNGKWKHVWVSD